MTLSKKNAVVPFLHCLSVDEISQFNDSQIYSDGRQAYLEKNHGKAFRLLSKSLINGNFSIKLKSTYMLMVTAIYMLFMRARDH